MKFYSVKVKELYSDGGKEKWKVFQDIYEAISTSDAEQQTVAQYKGLTIPWEIVSIAETKIREIHLQNQ